ncbi:LPXTG cell wall anchor domain-containing protein, partial [Modestobacter roseus]|nr:LPXTG cell wall anchor domain-containing protein [Modestobacter roseus]
YTGASIALPLALGTGLVALGGGALLVTRRRASGASQA